MAMPALQCQVKRMADKDKDERLAAALRENLRRRKSQSRELSQQPESDGAPQPDRKDG